MPNGYARRQPEKTELHGLVRENLETFLLEQREDGVGLPRYVEKELRSYLDCGQLEKGFCRVVCPDCGDELVIAFSCKKRGFCPSCCARRMSDTAAHLIDRVLPTVAYRQYVLAYPRRLRYAFARDGRAATESVRIMLREVFRWQRRQARAQGITRPLVGAVCVTQRHGSRVDLNVHHHCLLPDGVFAQSEGGELGFVELSPPSPEDLSTMLERIVVKTLAMVARGGLLEEEPCDALGKVQASTVQTGLALAIEPVPQKRAAFREGFSLEAGTHVRATDRQGLEHLLRYMLRPPLSLKRLRRLEDGRIELTLRRPMHDGTTAVAFTPQQFLRRLASIVPPPRWHATRYFGVFAPASKVRPRIVRADESPEDPGELDDGGAENARIAYELMGVLDHPLLPIEPPPMPERPRRLPWSDLLARVFATDVLRCPCGGRRKIVAFIPSSRTATEILERLGIDATAPPLSPARAPPRQMEAFEPAPEYGADERYPDEA